MKHETINRISFRQRLSSYRNNPLSFLLLLLVWCAMAATVFILLFIVFYILVNGVPHLTPGLFSPVYTTDNVSALPAIITTLLMVGLSLAIAVPFGIGCAIFLVEYAKKTNRFIRYVRLTTETLAGIPSIIYGLFGMLFFVIALKWNLSLLAGGFTLAIMVLPTIMRSTEEALKATPDAYREGSFGLGAGRLRTVFRIVLPSAMPGISAGIILSVGRIVGETAALIYTAGTVAKVPENIFASGRTLSIHMYLLAGEGIYTDQAYATAVILLGFVLVINFISSFITRKITKGQD
ncbi:phosphate ABC transporter permease PstA [Papillibacter cinnamivorans]|uniref:Phosphate transport system permease protein PstA n=1 Tax=Papillibacter cinnamivorans DSM 12816 TaxID=1122930 RepID=A0A1W2A9U4_9FIRM|nr:phosphate ABC transporter permease PstA [Papillibacter cinnamivorans]SMC57191.1 phosphate transport system permease protein [Papillibacter cinnamivorans DSM 12816]